MGLRPGPIRRRLAAGNTELSPTRKANNRPSCSGEKLQNPFNNRVLKFPFVLAAPQHGRRVCCVANT